MRYYIWLQEVLGAGNSRVKPILEHYKNAKALYEQSIKQLKESKLFTPREIEKIRKTNINNADKIIKKCKKEKILIMTIEDELYPECLRNIANPPLVLYYKGVFPDFDNEPVFCIVGPRKISDYGRKAAFSLSARLSRAGMIIVSGGALGSDTYVHKGVLKNGGKTVLLMGCGINYRYLPENEPMRKSIIENKGCLISEFPPDSPAIASHFPVRNRLMSALSLGVAVVEAPSRSGSLITASHALEQGKDVFVIPGTPGRPEYAGSNALLRDGAIPLIDTLDVFNEYISLFPDKINIERAYTKQSEPQIPSKNEKREKILNISLSKEAKMLYNQLDKVEFYPDDFVSSDLSEDDMLSALTELELCGVIKAVPGGKYTVL